MVTLTEKTKPQNTYQSPLNITDDIRQFTERRERRAKELGIALYILGEDPKNDSELQRLEDYIMENFIDLDLDVPDSVKEKYLTLKKEREKNDMDYGQTLS